MLWISGLHTCEEVVKNRPDSILEIVYSRREEAIHDILERAIKRKIPVKHLGREEMDRLIGYRNHQGIAVKVRSFIYEKLDKLLSTQPEHHSPLVLLDCLEDPQNFGSILRSAAFFGIKGVIIPEYRSVAVTDAVCRVSAGAVFLIPVIKVKNLAHTIDKLRNENFSIVGLDAHVPLSIYEAPLKNPIALVIGNEHKGMRRLTREKCHLIVNIPPSSSVESLNAAVAAAIAFSEIHRRNR